jgi:L-amino acid N-acyltransferase
LKGLKLLIIRPAEIKDLDEITEIYNDTVINTTATFDTETRTSEAAEKWFKAHDEKHQIIVGEMHGVIVGWAALSQWSDRAAYDGTAECSIYVKKEYRRQGIGRKLLYQLIRNAEFSNLHTIIARISEGNDTSIRMHREYDFKEIGVMKEAGMKFGKYIDVTIMQKMVEKTKS